MCILTACIEPVEFTFNPEAYQQQLVVDGRITLGEGPYTLNLKQTADFARDSLVEVSGAQITLFDELGNQERYTEISPGQYQLAGEIVTGVVGRAYHIEIDWEGNTYRSLPETMPERVGMDRIYKKLMDRRINTVTGSAVEKKFVDVFIDASIPDWDQGPYLRWEAEATWMIIETRSPDLFNQNLFIPNPLDFPLTCYFRDIPDPQSLILFNGDIFDIDLLEGQFVTGRSIDWTFFFRQVFQVYQYSMNREALAYWERVEEVINQRGSIFDTPPAVVRGNLSRVDDPGEIVLGYFEAVAVDTLELPIFRSDFRGIYITPLCQPDWYYFSRGELAPDQCYNCIEIKGATLQRPNYWD